MLNGPILFRHIQSLLALRFEKTQFTNLMIKVLHNGLPHIRIMKNGETLSRDIAIDLLGFLDTSASFDFVDRSLTVTDSFLQPLKALSLRLGRLFK